VDQQSARIDEIPVHRRAGSNDRRRSARIRRRDPQGKPVGLGRQERQQPAVRGPVQVERRPVGAPVDNERVGRRRARCPGREHVDAGPVRRLADRRDARAVRRPGRELESDTRHRIRDHGSVRHIDGGERPGRVNRRQPRAGWRRGRRWRRLDPVAADDVAAALDRGERHQGRHQDQCHRDLDAPAQTTGAHHLVGLRFERLGRRDLIHRHDHNTGSAIPTRALPFS